MIVSATGHRPNKLFTKGYYSKENTARLISFCVDEIMKLKQTHPIDKLIAGGALGWDNAIAHAAIRLNIPLLMAIPFEGMHSKWPQESQDDFHYCLSKAQEVVYVSEGGYENWKFYARDKYMVDNSDLVLALYNGDEKGGTAITVKYAKEVNRPIHNVWENWKLLRCES